MMSTRVKMKQVSYDVVVNGGGLSGMCVAIAAARNGAKTALVHARHVLGGNASSEIRMHVCGASENMAKPDLEEGGILYEMMLDNKSRNDYFCYSIWDMVLFDKVKRQENLTLYLNTVMDDCTVENGKIRQVTAYQQTTETRYIISGEIFVDCTGNSTLGYLAGAEYRIGSEGQSEFNEPHAPEKPNNNRMGNTLLFKAVDRGQSVNFKRPDFAKVFTEEHLRYRTHSAVHAAQIKEGADETYLHIATFGSSQVDYGYWWIELTGVREDIIDEYEEIRDELVACIYGVWDHLKNGGEHGAENYDLEWVGMMPGTRESRRLVGDYILNENDILANRQFDDAVAYGGWAMDIHTQKGLYDFDELPSQIIGFDGAYTIPYRSYYSKNISNLMMAGRNISASKMAMGSTRVMGTCAIGGQAVGTAAAMCIKYSCLPREISKYMNELQQTLLKDDCYIPNVQNTATKDLAKDAVVTASSVFEDNNPENITNGINRPIGNKKNLWISNGISDKGERISLKLQKQAAVSEVRLVFDSNFNYSIKQTMSVKRQKQQRIGVPPELVKNYTVQLFKEGEKVYETAVADNFQRLNVLHFAPVLCDEVMVTVHETNGCENAHIYEVRLYASNDISSMDADGLD